MKPSKMTLGTTLVTVAALGLFASACSSSSKSSGTPSATNATTTTSATTAAAPLTITATDYKFSGIPATIPAGIENVSFVNKGTVGHEAAFLHVTAGSDVKTVLAGLKSVGSGGAFPASYLGGTGVLETKPGATTDTQFNLVPGQYLVFCTLTGVVGSTKDGPPHFTRGMYQKLTVTGTGGDTIPTAETSLTAHDYGFDVSHLKAGTHTVAFDNVGPEQWHFADIAAFPKGVTVAQATADLPKLLASQGPPPAGVPSPKDLVTSQVASPDNGNTFKLTLEKGITYVVVCFFSDKTGGAPHAISHHMYKIFTVS